MSAVLWQRRMNPERQDCREIDVLRAEEKDDIKCRLCFPSSPLCILFPPRLSFLRFPSRFLLLALLPLILAFISPPFSAGTFLTDSIHHVESVRRCFAGPWQGSQWMVTGSNCPSLEEHHGNSEPSHPTAHDLTMRSPWRQEEEGGELRGLAEIQNPVERYQIPCAKGLNHRRNITKWMRNNASTGQVVKW